MIKQELEDELLILEIELATQLAKGENINDISIGSRIHIKALLRKYWWIHPDSDIDFNDFPITTNSLDPFNVGVQ